MWEEAMNRKLNGLSQVILVASALGLTLVALALPRARSSAVGGERAGGGARGDGGQERSEAMPPLQGAQAREYLEGRGEYQSLMEAATAARFGLKWEERSPFGDVGGGGYLGMSHVQNLNAWFDTEGVTVRPTLPEEERVAGWRLSMRLKAYGYGAQLTSAPPIVSHEVKENPSSMSAPISDRGMRISDYSLQVLDRK
jgi:hypothetical protein